ncbi:uncharacterized protein LOC141632357 [Silene latifolia]|uniref:uncharacterized protein LOC141632357 n=1 Tax=Silene latifolia TaxID=37657 RepID=UPI003D77A366
MGFSEKDLVRKAVPLVGFSEETKYSLGDIVIPIFAGGIIKQVRKYAETKRKLETVTRMLSNLQRVHQHSNYRGYYTSSIRQKLLEFLRTNMDCFAWSHDDMVGIYPSVITHRLNVNANYQPVQHKRRKFSPERNEVINQEIENLLAVGKIREVKYPEWISNVVVVPKKNNKWRVCVDFMDLNTACPKDLFPLPHIDAMVDETTGHEMLIFLDAWSGYNQSKMHPHDQEKTAFRSERGMYCYNVMPFGLKNVGSTYQRLVKKMFKNEIGRTMEVYIDDMVVKSKQAEQHMAHLENTFEILRKYHMKLNPLKCTFGVSSGKFLGYLVTQRGIEASTEQIRAVLQLESPQKPKEVQRLTERMAALNRFISMSSDRCRLFYDILRKSKRFEWAEEHEKAFDELKSYMSTPPLLSKPKLGEPLYLYLSVIEVAVSAVLATNNESEYEAPILELQLALDLQVSHIEVYSDSQLIVNHVNDSYVVRDSKMVAYLKVAKDLKLCFNTFFIKQVPRDQNAEAEVLATLGATFKPRVISTVPIIRVLEPAICQQEHDGPNKATYSQWTNEPGVMCTLTTQDEPPHWRQPYHDWLQNDVLYADKKEVMSFKMKASKFVLIDNILFRRLMAGPYLRCLSSQEAQAIMHDIHNGECGNHVGGPLPRASENRVYILTMTDYFSKWIEAEAFPQVLERYDCITEDKNQVEMASNLDTVDEIRTGAQIRMTAYKQTAARSYNRNVRIGTLQVGDLVLRKVFQNTKNQQAGKFAYNWEVPYQVESVVGNGAYKLMTMEGKLIHKPWNITHLKEY